MQLFNTPASHVIDLNILFSHKKQFFSAQPTFAIWTTLGNSVRQEIGITSWWVLNFDLDLKDEKRIIKFYKITITNYSL